MKLAGVLIITIILQACNSSQDFKRLNYSGDSVAIEEIFSVIKKQTDVHFFYDVNLIRDAKPVTIKWENVTLEAALNEVFKGQMITWVLEDKTVTIIKKPGNNNNNKSH